MGTVNVFVLHAIWVGLHPDLNTRTIGRGFFFCVKPWERGACFSPPGVRAAVIFLVIFSRHARLSKRNERGTTRPRILIVYACCDLILTEVFRWRHGRTVYSWTTTRERLDSAIFQLKDITRSCESEKVSFCPFFLFSLWLCIFFKGGDSRFPCFAFKNTILRISPARQPSTQGF